MITWCVAHTQPQKETIAQQHLLDQGFDVYLPRFKTTRRHARNVQEVLAPLFPRYIFVGMDLDVAPWRKVNGTRGVSYLLMTDDYHPARVPLQVLEKIRAQDTGSGIVPIDTLIPFVQGDVVRVLEGGFQDQVGVFDQLDDRGRVHILLNLLGKEARLTLYPHAIEAA